MTDHRTDRLMLWIAVLTLALGILTSVIAASVHAGTMDTKVEALEKAASQEITRGEWTTFTQDVRDRLDRIEDKVDHAHQ